MRANHLYIHVPFCARRCVYCDFSIAVRAHVPVAEYNQAVAAEWDARHASSAFDLSTLYLGGGTPSKLGGEGVARLLDLIRQRASIRADAEVTLEANPDDVTAEGAAAWQRAGVNRVSLGVQSFDDAMLRWMHRSHDAAQARQALQVLRDAGIANVSVDLIFATPGTIARSWKRDLDAVLELDVPHVSVYGLTVESHTPLGRWVARNDVDEAPEERFEQEFVQAHEALGAEGFEHYEVSNYGKPGMHSRHNWAYWTRSPYAGLGPSAHEFDGATRRWNISPYVEWARAAVSAGATESGEETLGPDQVEAEQTYLGLRTTTGVHVPDEDLETFGPWIDANWAVRDEAGTLRLTPLGWLRLDAIASSLTILRSRY